MDGRKIVLLNHQSLKGIKIKQILFSPKIGDKMLT